MCIVMEEDPLPCCPQLRAMMSNAVMLTLQYTFLDILIYSLKQNWPDIPGVSAIHSVFELARHKVYFMSFLYRLLDVECFTVCV